MTILVYKDGRLLIDNEQPLEGVSLDNLAAILSNPKDGDVVKYDEKSGMWIAGEAGGGSNKFIVTLTPTSPDFSGTMDKTVAEINAAYEAGMEIVFRLMVSSGVYYDFATTVTYIGAHPYPEHFCMGAVGSNLIVFSSDTDNPENTAYHTAIYPLTPAS